jgi:CelD/BcsL family acetyltransferase involved in cellulose biosynthesis
MNANLLEPPANGRMVDATTAGRQVRCSPLASLESSLCAEWRELFARDLDGCALQHPDYVLSESRFLATERHEPLLTTASCGGRLCGAGALLPKSVRTAQAGGIGPSWRLLGYRLAGSRFLSDGADDEELLRGALDAVRRRNADFLMIEDLDQSSTLWNLVESGLPGGWSVFAPHGFQARLKIRLPECASDYWSRFSSKTRGTFRRKLKKFGTTRLERITTSDQVAGFLATAHEVSLQTWQTRRFGLRVRNDAAERAALAALADAGLLRCYLWFSNEEPAAFCVGNQAHGVFHYEEVGYATKFARFSPGQMLVVQMIDDLLEHRRPDWFDFGGGDADYKRMFANHVSSSGTVWLIPPSRRMRALLGWCRLCRAGKQAARHAVARLGLATRVRQWIRYGLHRPGFAIDAADQEDST